MSRKLPSQLEHELSSYRMPYRAVKNLVVKETDNAGMERLLLDHCWHSGKAFNLPPHAVLAVINTETPALPGQSLHFFRATKPGVLLSGADAYQEWQKMPFAKKRAKAYGYFPYLVPDLEPLTKQRVWDQYFQPPSQPLLDKWVTLAREVGQSANCLKRQFGAIVVDNGRVLAAGNNHTHVGFRHAQCEPCIRENIPSGTRVEACNADHAEWSTVITALNRNVRFLTSLMVVAGQEPDGSPFKNPIFYCTVCSRILAGVEGLFGVITDTGEGGKLRSIPEIVDESYRYLAPSLPSA